MIKWCNYLIAPQRLPASAPGTTRRCCSAHSSCTSAAIHGHTLHTTHRSPQHAQNCPSAVRTAWNIFTNWRSARHPIQLVTLFIIVLITSHHNSQGNAMGAGRQTGWLLPLVLCAPMCEQESESQVMQRTKFCVGALDVFTPAVDGLHKSRPGSGREKSTYIHIYSLCGKTECTVTETRNTTSIGSIAVPPPRTNASKTVGVV